MKAYSILSLKFNVNYILSQHASDEAVYYKNKIKGTTSQDEDISLTLNMFKLKSGPDT